MRTVNQGIGIVLNIVVIGCLLLAGVPAPAGTTPLGSSFSYQGVLNSGGSPYNGTADFQFTLWEVASGPPQVATSGTLTANGVVVTNGVFSLDLNFGATAFDGNERYLQIAVHTPGNGGAGPFTTLTPRQKLLAVPYAQYALNAGLISGTQSNAIAFSNPSNTYAGSSMSLDGGTFHVDPLGNRVGINTTMPLSPLDVRGGNVRVTPTSNPLGGYHIMQGTTSTGVFGLVGGDAWLGNANAGSLVLGTYASPGAVDDCVHIYPSGRIHMGAGSLAPEPTALVHISNSSAGVPMNPNSTLALEKNAANYLNILAPDPDETGILFGKPTGGAESGGIIYNNAATPDGLQFRANGNVNRLVISSEGNVGIGGITGPAARLDVFNGQDTSVLNTAIFRIATPGSNYSHVHNGPNGDWYIRSAVNGGKVIIQDVPGNVGIGTSNPQAKLHVALGDVLVENGGVSLRENSTLIGSLQIGAPAELALANYDAGDLAFATSTTVGGPASTRMSIKPSGLVGIGTLSPGTRLHVINSLGTQNALQADNNAPAGGGLASGVVGITNQANAFAGGVRGFNANSAGTAVIGSGNNLGPTTLAGGSGGAFTGNATGVLANSTTAGFGEGLLARQFGLDVRVSHWNGSSFFKILGPGTVSTIVNDIEEKPVTMFAPEAPEVLFQDFGDGMLINGFAHIDLDPSFAKNVLIDALHPMRVFIQLEGDENCQGVVVKNKTATGFDVVELRGGRSNTPFQYLITCSRADQMLPDGRVSRYAGLRFPPAPAPAPTLTAEGDPLTAGQVQPQPDVNPNPEG